MSTNRSRRRFLSEVKQFDPLLISTLYIAPSTPGRIGLTTAAAADLGCLPLRHPPALGEQEGNALVRLFGLVEGERAAL